MTFLIGGANSLTAGYDIDNSLRFNAAGEDYLVDTSNILYNYYDSIENTKESDTKNVKTILDFFNPIKNESSPREDINVDSNRSKLLDQYLECTDKNYINSNLICEEDKCIYCNSKICAFTE